MAQEKKPKKNKINLSDVLTNPAKVIGELLEDPEVADKLALAVSKLPPEAMDILAQRVAEYMPRPPTADEIAERLEVRIPQGVASGSTSDFEALKSQVSDLVMDSMSKVQGQITMMLEQLKVMQDEQPQLIEKQVTLFWNREMEAFKKQAETTKQELLALRGNGGGVEPLPDGTGREGQPQPGYSAIRGIARDIIDALPTITDLIKTLKPPPPQNLPAKQLVDAWVDGVTSGNRLRIGEAKPEELGKSLLNLISPPAAK